MTQIITIDKVREYYHVPRIDERYFKSLVQDVFLTQFKKKFGCDAYLGKMFDNPDNYTSFFNDDILELDGKKFIIVGFNKIFSTYVYSNLINQGAFIVTPYGVKIKNAGESNDVTDSQRFALANKYLKIADNYTSDFKDVLRATNLYDYAKICNCDNDTSNIFNIEMISR